VITIPGKILGYINMRSFGKTSWLTGLLGLVTVLLTGCFLTQQQKPQPPPEPPPPPQALQIGQRVSLSYFIPGGASETPVEEQVKDNGTINVKHIGPINVLGKLPSEVEQIIYTNLVPAYYKSLTITVTPLDQSFFVGGQVTHSGQLRYSGRTTLIGAIQAAGDFTDFADRHHIQITRTTGKIEIVDFEDAKANPSKDLEIYPGDKVIVDRRF
jgi:protein involved in polysaccharide export with SLBB domain